MTTLETFLIERGVIGSLLIMPNQIDLAIENNLLPKHFNEIEFRKIYTEMLRQVKDMGKIVYTNDVLNFNYYIAKALIENNNEKITQEEINTILIKKEDLIYDNFIERTFEDIYFLTEENKWLDIVIQNIYEIENEYKKAMFLWAIYQATLSKRPYNLFHRKNLNFSYK